ncbi:MAG: glycosyltransferase [Bacteroidota bacterium]
MMDWTLIFALIFYAAVGCQLFFWGILFTRLLFKKASPKGAHYQGPVSVILCAKNEAENLKLHLPAILNQIYPSFEVIVVDDQSSDGSQELLKQLQKQHPKLKILTIGQEEDSGAGKKYALSRGIQSAQYEVVLLTDADCQVASPNWITRMVEGLTPGKDIVLGYGPYTKTTGWVNRFTRFETVYAAIQYFSFASWGMPYMAVGRNLAYRKRLFEEIGGFKSHETVISGDDDLFIRDAANPFNVSLVQDTEAFTYSASKENWRSYLRQKSRHISTSIHYRPLIKFLLTALSMSHFAFFGWFLISLVFHISVSSQIELATLRYVTTYTVYGVYLTKWKQLDLLPWLPVLEIILVLYFVVLTPLLFIRKAIPWK